MLDPTTKPPPLNRELTTHAADHAHPLIGHLILNWTFLDNLMTIMIHDARLLKYSTGQTDKKPNREVSHKFKERLNEWIRLCLPPLELEAKSEEYRREILHLQEIRNDVAHNIQLLWLDDAGKLVAKTRKENARFLYYEDDEGDHEQEILLTQTEGHALAQIKIYEEDDILNATDAIHILYQAMKEMRLPLMKTLLQ
jgi:hypothetical protein